MNSDRVNRHVERPVDICKGIFYREIPFSILIKEFPFLFSHPTVSASQTVDSKCKMNYKPTSNWVYLGHHATYKRS